MNEYFVLSLYGKAVYAKFVGNKHILRSSQKLTVQVNIAHRIYSLKKNKRILVRFKITFKACGII